MKKDVFLGVKVSFPSVMEEDEVLWYVKGQLDLKPDKRLVSMEVELDGAEVVLRPHYDTVRRLRRITGYLSNTSNFNDAKRAEERARVRHIKNCSK